MAKCMHTNHRDDTVKFNREGKKSIKVEVLMGWNPVRRRMELCDVGLVEKRGYRGRTEAGKS